MLHTKTQSDMNLRSDSMHPRSCCNTWQHTATLCNTLQHTATYCNAERHEPQERLHESSPLEPAGIPAKIFSGQNSSGGEGMGGGSVGVDWRVVIPARVTVDEEVCMTLICVDMTY